MNYHRVYSCASFFITLSIDSTDVVALPRVSAMFYVAHHIIIFLQRKSPVQDVERLRERSTSGLSFAYRLAQGRRTSWWKQFSFSVVLHLSGKGVTAGACKMERGATATFPLGTVTVLRGKNE